jgi:plastocyanin
MIPSLRLLVLPILLLAACGGESDDADEREGEHRETPDAVAAVPLTGTIIEVTMTTNDKGNYFEPAEITARPGDVIRYKLVQGVHNVNFLPDSSPGHAGLPAPTAFAQLPGQTFDIPMTFGSGRFYFQCDPHAMLGMVGHVTVAP